MKELLTQSGLTAAQADAYLFLLDNGPAAPPVVASALSLTRSNAYKVLDSLLELGLVSRDEHRKKFVYTPTDPTALATLVAVKRNEVIALEQHVKTAMTQLRAKYQKHAITNVESSSGQDAIASAYKIQSESPHDIYFIKSRADIPFMGYDVMHKIRQMPAAQAVIRYGLTPDSPEIPSKEADIVSRLERTLIPAKDYTAPVEWSVSGDELLIIKFDGDGTVIRITDAEIADSFRQVWQIARHGY